MTLIIALNYALFLVFFAYMFRKGWADRRMVMIFAMAFFGITAALRPALFLLGLDTPSPDYLFGGRDMDLIGKTVLLVFIWTLIFFPTYFILVGATSTANVQSAKRLPNANYIYLISILMTLAGGSIVAYFVLRAGSYVNFMVEVKSEKSFTGLYFLRQFNIIAILVCIYGLVALSVPAVSKKRQRRIRREDQIVLGGLIILNFMALYAWGYRNQIAFSSAIFLLAYHTFIRRINVVTILAIVVIGFGFLHWLRFLREDLRAAEIGVHAIVLADTSAVRGFSMSMHLVQFDGLMLAVRDLGDVVSLRNGTDFWNGLISWLPRFMVPDRETFFVGGWFRRLYEPTRANGWPITIIGSWLVNFGYFGVVLGSAVSAATIALFDRFFKFAACDPWQFVFASAIGAFMFDGGYNTGTPQDIVLTLIPLLIVGRFVLRRVPPLK